jgi:hypothetical protein
MLKEKGSAAGQVAQASDEVIYKIDIPANRVRHALLEGYACVSTCSHEAKAFKVAA